MSWRGIANGFTRTVNPNVVGSVYFDAGTYQTGRGGARTPTYHRVDGVELQVQMLSGADLKRLDSLNIQGVMRAVYVNGQLDGVRRTLNKGGDILAFGGSYWLVTQVLEPWDASGWCKVAVTEQTDRPAAAAIVSSFSAAVVLVPA